uniref:HAD family phosphatase n=1 Tax=Strongyloides stercoralis TaxID=6248 RepID=A0A0K0EBS9_STRER
MASPDKNIKAFIYDMGGVVLKYSSDEIADFVKKPTSLAGEDFKLLETGVITFEEFVEKASDDDPFKKLFKSSEDVKQKAKLFLSSLVKDENIEKSIKVLKENGYKVVLLTNNFFLDKNRQRKTVHCDVTHFDNVVESCKVGMRKPDKDIYEYTLSLLNLKPYEAVFLDDLEPNCNGAKSVGLKTIQVETNKSEDAVREIEQLTGLSIL